MTYIGLDIHMYMLGLNPVSLGLNKPGGGVSLQSACMTGGAIYSGCHETGPSFQEVGRLHNASGQEDFVQ